MNTSNTTMSRGPTHACKQAAAAAATAAATTATTTIQK